MKRPQADQWVLTLDDLDFTWDLLAELWKVNYDALEDYATGHGSIHVPYNYVTESGLKLAQWRKEQLRNQVQLSKERRLLLESLPGWTWDTYFDELWEQRYSSLVTYAEKYGDARPPATYKTKDGHPLGNWVIIQRKFKSRLNSDQIERLESVRGWAWSVNDYLWEQALSELRQFHEEFGHVKVEFGFKGPSGFSLGQWVSDVRKKYFSNNLSFEKVESLKKFSGWVWSVHDLKWEHQFQKLQKFQEREGHCIVLQKWKEDGESLGIWVSAQRRAQHTMSADRKQRLDALGFVWDARNESS